MNTDKLETVVHSINKFKTAYKIPDASGYTSINFEQEELRYIIEFLEQSVINYTCSFNNKENFHV